MEKKKVVFIPSESKADLFGVLEEDGSVRLLCGFPEDKIKTNKYTVIEELTWEELNEGKEKR